MSEVEKIPTVLDSSQTQVGEVYARALLAEAQRLGKLDQLVDELEQFGKVLIAVRGMQAALESPRLSYDDKANLIDKALTHRADPLLINFVKLLAKRGRFNCYQAVQSAASKLQDEIAGRVRAQVFSAEALGVDSKERLQHGLSKVLKKQVLLTEKQDPAVIGGLVVRVGDTVFDSSVANRLKQLKAKAIKGVSDAVRQSIERFATEQ